MSRVRQKSEARKSNGANPGFEEKLWQAADKLRGHMDAAEYKHVVLGLIFLKYISDAFEEHYNRVLKEGTGNQIAEVRKNYTDKNIFRVPEKARWSYLHANADGEKIGRITDDAMKLLEEQNPSLVDILPKGYSRPTLNNCLNGLIQLVSTIGLGDEESRSRDVLGRVYEYFLGRFAKADSRGGEFYTPQSVVKLLVEMVEPFQGKVYDPCCGSGGIFVQSKRFVQAHGGRATDISIYGQESNHTTWRLCRMNLAIRDINGNIGASNADTFHTDLHETLQADYILANPPFNIREWGGLELRKDKRWEYGVPPQNSANFAWVQHIIHHLSPSGLAGVVLSNGSLSANQGEGDIRRNLIEADVIDCIVALPGQLFYNTQIAACLWFLTRNKNGRELRDRRGETLFIYAQNSGEMIDRTHRELTEDDINRIAGTYHNWRSKKAPFRYKDVPGFCKSASINEIESHKWALVPGRYVGFDKSLIQGWDMARLKEEITDAEVRLMNIDKASQSALQILKELLNG